jgi:hypothetical protein
MTDKKSRGSHGPTKDENARSMALTPAPQEVQES